MTTPAYLLSLPELHAIAEWRTWTPDEARRAAELLAILERAAEAGAKLAASDVGGLFAGEPRP